MLPLESSFEPAVPSLVEDMTYQSALIVVHKILPLLLCTPGHEDLLRANNNWSLDRVSSAYLPHVETGHDRGHVDKILAKLLSRWDRVQLGQNERLAVLENILAFQLGEVVHEIRTHLCFLPGVENCVWIQVQVEVMRRCDQLLLEIHGRLNDCFKAAGEKSIPFPISAKGAKDGSQFSRQILEAGASVFLVFSAANYSIKRLGPPASHSIEILQVRRVSNHWGVFKIRLLTSLRFNVRQH